MKVTGVKVDPVSVPFTEPETWRFGRLWGLTSAIVQVETDEGITGIGESLGSPYINLVVEAIETNARWLVGEDPRQIGRFVADAEDRGWHHYPYIGHMASAALETALWDIVGKAYGCPAWQFFGGLRRERVPYYWYVTAHPERTPEVVRRQAREGVDRGFGTMYMKIGFDIDGDLALTQAIRDEVGPDVRIRVDVNEGWSRFEAAKALPAFGEVGVEFVEEPIDMHDVEGLAFLRRQTGARVGANQSAWFAHDAKRVLFQDAADVVVTDQHQLGGLSVFRDVAAMCHIAGIPVIKHAFGDLGITTVAGLHLLATLPEPALAHQQFIQITEHDMLAPQLEFRDGSLAVPTGPGLGVELDLEALAHYREIYEKYGEFEGYSPGFGPNPVPKEELRGKATG
jgi:L-alanine-DL-glutamate epimerase-like enolase superfamily enzyme